MAESVPASDIPEAQERKGGGRKRTARACDECRLRKSKCDGLCPCESCQTTDRYCTFNLSAARGTNSGTRIRILEDRLRRARAYLVEAQRRTPSLAHVNFDALLGPLEASPRNDQKRDIDGAEDDEDNEKLDSMMDSYGQLTMDTNGSMHRDFYGAASGLAWIQKTRNYFEESNTSERDEGHEPAAVQLFDAPLPPRRLLHVQESIENLIPPRDVAERLLDVVVAQIYPLFHFVCEIEFSESMDRIYDLAASEYEESDHSFLPLFALVMALGYLFSKRDHDQMGCRGAVAQGMRYFIAARDVIDIAQLRTVTALQSVVCLILFLVSTARMASAHAFLGAACASAMRQGLHFRSSHDSNLSFREKRLRRRVFWAIMNLDMYVSSILGLPQFMDLSAVDPAIDLTIDIALRDAKMDTRLSPMDKLALIASARHISLLRIVKRGQSTLYPKPSDPPDSNQRNGTISISVSKFSRVEDQFRAWTESANDVLAHPENSNMAQTIKYELSCAYYFSQMLLYRAFVHYLAKQNEEDKLSERQLSYATTCVQMAKRVIELSVEHAEKGLLCPASWSAIYTVFIGTVCLIFAYATRVSGEEAPELKATIENAIRLLASTACTTDTGSVRCLYVVKSLIRRVQYAVDVNVDEICATTRPCCNAVYYHPTGGTKGLRSLHIPERKASTFSQSQASTSTKDGRAWSDPQGDVTMTYPGSLNDQQSTARITQQSLPLFYDPAEEMLELPAGGGFFHPADMRFDGNRRETTGASNPEPGHGSCNVGDVPITSDDIAAFMHINPVDRNYRS